MDRPPPLSPRQAAAVLKAAEVLEKAGTAFGKYGRVRHLDMLLQAATEDAGIVVEEPNRHSMDHWEAMELERFTFVGPGFGMIERSVGPRRLTPRGRETLAAVLKPLSD